MIHGVEDLLLRPVDPERINMVEYKTVDFKVTLKGTVKTRMGPSATLFDRVDDEMFWLRAFRGKPRPGDPVVGEVHLVKPGRPKQQKKSSQD